MTVASPRSPVRPAGAEGRRADAHLRIGFFTCNYRPLVSGLATALDSYAGAFRARGHRVLIFAPRYRRERLEPDVFRFASVRVPTHGAYVLPVPASLRIGRLIPRLGLDVIHAHHPFLVGPYAARWARRLGVPMVFTHHTLYERYAHYAPLGTPVAARYAAARSAAFADGADLVIAPSRAVAADLRARGVRAPIAVVPTGVDLGHQAAEDPAGIREALGIPCDVPLLLSVGRLAPEKNPDLLLRAFGLVAAADPRAWLLLVGGGDEAGRLRRLAAGVGVGDRVRFVGEVPHEAVGRYYAAADLFLFASTSEAQGLVVLEAMARGRPVVAVASPTIAEVVRDGIEGCLTGDGPEALAAAAVALLRDPDRRRAMGHQARERSRAFSAEASADRVLALYAQLIDEGRRATRG